MQGTVLSSGRALNTTSTGRVCRFALLVDSELGHPTPCINLSSWQRKPLVLLHDKAPSKSSEEGFLANSRFQVLSESGL